MQHITTSMTRRGRTSTRYLYILTLLVLGQFDPCREGEESAAPCVWQQPVSLCLAAARLLVFGSSPSDAGRLRCGQIRSHNQIRVMTDVQGADPVVQQATVNMLADMMVQPAALVGDLQRAQASTDTSGPWCDISVLVTPWQSDGVWTVSGAAGESTGGAAGEGRVAGVEVSLDGGQRWHPADALEGLDKGPGAWRFVCGNEAWHGLYDDMCGDGWKTQAISARAKLMLLTQVLCRAVDDSLNIGTVSSAAAAADAGKLSQRSEL